MMKTIGYGLALCMTAAWLVLLGMAGAANRDKVLTEPGVYGTFAVFLTDAEWGKLGHNRLDWYGMRGQP